MNVTATKTASETKTRSEQKWGRELIAAGFTIIPDIIIEKQAALGLKPLDFAVLMVLCTYWWDPDKPARPGKQRVADALGILPRTVQKSVQKMEKLGILTRVARKNRAGDNDPNEYVLSGLVERARPYALEKLELRRVKDEAEAKRVRRARPSPKLRPVG
jgi:hypothetical protein